MSNLNNIKNDILTRAETDPAFMAGLLEDPKAAIEKYFPQPNGASLPKNLKFKVVEDSEDTIYLNVNRPVSLKDGY